MPSPAGPTLSAPTLDEGSSAPTRLPAAAPQVPDVGQDDDPRWEWRGELGWGGMGRVSLAFDRVLGREVAIKEPTSDLDERIFLRECRITARLEHPGIVPIYELGRGTHGRPWFSMRVVRGRSLADLLGDANSPGGRLTLLRHVRAAAEAVASAHASGIVHRDLKPANILVGTFGETQVIDWGLASAPGLEGEDFTGGGTPTAMSPEQVRGELQGPPSDVWSLGIVLWHLVVGRSPWLGLDRDEIIRALLRGHIPDPAQAAPEAPGELLAILRRALAPRPEARYPDAAALAADLGRFIDGGLVSAHDYSRWALLARLVRAWWVPLTVAAVAVVVIAFLVILGFARLSEERRRTELNLALSLLTSARQAFALDARGDAEVLAAHALGRTELPEARGILAALPSPRPRIDRLGALACDPLDALGATDHEVVLCRRDEDLMVLDRSQLRWHTMIPGLRTAAFYGRGEGVAVLGPRGIERYDARTGERLGDATPTMCGRRFRVSPDHEVAFVNGASCVSEVSRKGVWTHPTPCGEADLAAYAVAADGRGKLSLCKDGRLLLGDPDGQGGVTVHVAPDNVVASEVSALALTSRGLVLYGNNQGEVMIAPLDAAEAGRVVRGQGVVLALTISPSGRFAAITWEVGSPLVVNLDATASLGRVPGSGVRLVVFVADTRLLAAGRQLTRLDYSSVRPRAHPLDHGVASLAVSQDGERLAVASGEAVSVIATATRARLGTAPLGAGFVKALAYRPGGHTLLAHTLKGRRLFAIEGDHSIHVTPRPLPDPDRLWRAMAILPDGTMLGAPFNEGLVRVRPGEGRRPEQIDPVAMEHLVANGDRVAALGVDQLPRLGTGLDGEGRLAVCDRETVARGIALDASAPGLVVAVDGGLELRCLVDGGGLRYRVEGAEAISVAAGSGYLAAGGRDGSVWMWRRGDARPWAIVREHTARVGVLVFDPLGRWLASGGWDGVVAFIDLPSTDTRADLSNAEEVERVWGLELEEVLRERLPGAAR